MPRQAHRRRSGGRRRVALDWVYRPSGNENVSSTPGAYNGSQNVLQATNSVAAGIINSNVYVLYDSQDYLEQMTYESATLGGVGLPQAARAEGRRASCYRVQGTIAWFPTTGWASGSQYVWGARLMWCEQDHTNGGALLDPPYSMWEPEIIAGAHSEVTTYANNRLLNMREIRMYQSFNVETPTQYRSIGINWKVPYRRAPSSQHALYLYVEAPANSLLALTTVVAQFNINLRTLVSDEG